LSIPWSCAPRSRYAPSLRQRADESHESYVDLTNSL
jgi:hypothetical protein